MSDPRRDGEMTFRLPPGAIVTQALGEDTAVRGPRPGFDIVITDADGAELLTMTEMDGRLVVGGDEARWGEGAKRFLYGMMQWSGQVGISWKDDIKKAAQDGQW